MSYSYFAQYYDVLTENVDYPARADYITELMKRHGHEPGKILDLACGTGTLTIELKKRGLDIMGADMSQEMLSQAQMNCFDAGVEIFFFCQKMQQLCIPEKIGTCLCMLDSINHITSKRELTAAFSKIHEYLDDDGLFIFDANTVYKHSHILADNCYIYDTEKVFCAWQNNYIEHNNKVIITLDFFEKDGGIYRRSSEQFSERAYTHGEMEEMLGKAGLTIETVYDDLSFSPPGETSQREIFVVRKKENGK